MLLEMTDKLALDVVVPSGRPNVKKLNAIANLKQPIGSEVNFIFVIDAPDFPKENLFSLANREHITIIKNERNLGAHISRNKGFEAGRGEYVLFIDDDTDQPQDLLEHYATAIKSEPDSPGFIGPVYFPPSINSHTNAAVASDILTFWDIASYSPKLAWGITANLMVKREAVGSIRFSDQFPKKGGGEDVDFCLRIVEKSGSWFTSVPAAKIVHPWWNEGQSQYRRFARWAYGDSSLPKRHSKYKFRNAPNFIETALIFSVVSALAFMAFKTSMVWLFVWLIAAFCSELLMDGLRMRLAGKNQSMIVSTQATLIRLSNDIGRLLGHIKHLRIQGLTERFDYFMTGEHINYERRVASLKFSAYSILALILFLFFI
jgi:GT2 family glycosyltransferase